MFDAKSVASILLIAACAIAAEWLARKGRVALLADMRGPAFVLFALAAAFVVTAVAGGFAIYGTDW